LKIFFGRLPRNPVLRNRLNNIDLIFLDYLTAADFNYETAVDNLVAHYFRNDAAYYTCNPLIINFFTDDFAKQNVYIIDEDDNEIHMGTDEFLLKKLEWGGPGDAVCDDTRSFTSNYKTEDTEDETY
jgi:hypothetical protein